MRNSSQDSFFIPRTLCLLLLFLVMASGGHAEEGSITGDPAYGEYLSGECTTCHKSGGEHGAIPQLDGWPAENFVETMLEYKNGKRNHQVMELITSRLGEEEIHALAVYYAGRAIGE